MKFNFDVMTQLNLINSSAVSNKMPHNRMLAMMALEHYLMSIMDEALHLQRMQSEAFARYIESLRKLSIPDNTITNITRMLDLSLKQFIFETVGHMLHYRTHNYVVSITTDADAIIDINIKPFTIETIIENEALDVDDILDDGGWVDSRLRNIHENYFRRVDY